MVSSLENNYIYISTRFIDGTLTGTINPSKSEPGGNGNEEILHALQSSWIGASPSDEF